MNRQQRRKQEREINKNLKTISNLNPQQAKIIDIAAREKAKEIAHAKVEELSYLLDRCTSAALVEKDWNFNQIEDFQIRITELLQEDTEKSNKLEKENADMAKIEKEVRQAVEGLLEKGVGKKQSIDNLVFKFPKLSKSMLLNAYAKVREETDEAAEKIINIIEGESNEEEPVIEKNITDHIKEEEKMEGLKVLEEKVVKTIKVQGENGEYEAETGKGVVLTRENNSLYFENEEQLEEFVSEFKRVFAMLK